MNDTPRIYVANLSAYVCGYLQGIWIDATEDLENIRLQIAEMLKYSIIPGADEYAIHDHENFGGYHIGEFDSIEVVHEAALFIQEFPDFGSELLAHFGDIDQAREHAEENYRGCYRSLSNFAQELTEESTDIPSHLAGYIDYQSMGRDMEMSGDVFTVESGFEKVHVFWSR